LKKDLTELIEFVVEHKTFSFQESDVSFNCDELISSGVLIRQPNQIKIGDSLLFTKGLYNHFAFKLSFTLSSDVQAAMEFYHKLQEDFMVEMKVVMGITEQMRNLLTYLVESINKDFGVTFEDFALALNKNDRFLYEFSSSLFQCLNDLEIEAKNLYPILIHLHEQVNSDVQYNMNLGELTKAIQNYCIQHPDKGVKLLELHHEKESEPKVSIHAAILTGLYKSNREEELERIKELVKDDFNHVSIACAISAFEPENNSEATNLLDTIDSIKSVADSYVINLPRLYVNFIDNKNVSDSEIHKRCFAKLQELLEFDHIGIKQNTLWQLQFVKGYGEDVFKIIDSLNKTPLEENLYKVLNDVLTRFEDQKYFFQFLRGYSVNNKMKFEAKKFEFPISKFKNENPPNFGKYLIKLLIDNDGGIRFIGKRILSHLRIVIHNNYQFEYDILDLSALEQYKLWVSVFQDSPEPKYSFPLLLPLRKSKYPIIAEAFICKLEQLIESYTSSVVSVLKEHLDLTDDDDKKLLARIDSKYEEFGRYWDKKVKVKELNPLYTQSKLYEIYQEGFGDSLSSNMEDSVQDNSSFLSLITTITLAKGGGWKHEKGGQVSQLSTIGTSFQFPREYYIRPERFDFENRVSFTENWENEFNEWEATISSLGNI
jgi:hypothetical protein